MLFVKFPVVSEMKLRLLKELKNRVYVYFCSVNLEHYSDKCLATTSPIRTSLYSQSEMHSMYVSLVLIALERQKRLYYSAALEGTLRLIL